MSVINSILHRPPKVHKGGKIAYSILPKLGEFILERVNDSSATLETGCGLSTVLFAVAKSDHICVVPFSEEVDLLRAYCKTNEVDLSRVKFVIGQSQFELTKLSEATSLDFVLIDGGHEFPTPFIDWYYAERLLKLGGIMVVDDTQLWTGAVLRSFMSLEPEWRLVNEWWGRAAAFEKVGHGSASKSWIHQEFVRRRSRWSRSLCHVRTRLAVLMHKY